MDSDTLVSDRATTGTTYDVLLRATVTTRFRARDRWLIAGSFADEAAGRQEFISLGREFPTDSVSLTLVRCDAEYATGIFREHVLDKREPTPGGKQHRFPRAAPNPGDAPRARGTMGQRPVGLPPPPVPPSNAALRWRLAGGIALATMLISQLL